MAMAKAARKRICTRRMAGWTVGLLAVLAMLCMAADIYVGGFSKGRLYHNAADVPHRRAAVLLGCGKYAHGRNNLFYTHRINAAVEIWQAGKVDAILISGDNSRKDYDEPGTMKADLVARGVPAEFITLDCAGFSTLDSVIRAEEIFELDDYIVISQRFHCQRAIYLAGRKGQSVIGFCAANPSGPYSTKVRLREVAARAKALLDITLARNPKFLGPKEQIHYRQSSISIAGTENAL